MECVLLSIMLFAGCSVAWVVGSALRTSGWNHAYRQLAARRIVDQKEGAAFIPSGWFGYPLVRFHHSSGERVRVGPFLSRARGRQLYTQVQIDWHDAHYQCEIYPRMGRVRPRRLANVDDVFIHSRQFSSMYQVRANDASNTVQVLNETVQWQIEKLRRFGTVAIVHIYFNYGRLIIAKPEAIRDPAKLNQFVDLALGLFDQAVMTGSEGIDFVNDQAHIQAVDASCLVCGDQITSDLVYCTSCNTPHHRECWLYYGACSTYGCQETTFHVPPIAQPEP